LGKSNRQLYDREEKSGEVKKLKAHIRKLEHEISRLKSELKTYDRAFQKNLVFLKEKTKELTLEDLLKGAEQELSLKQIKNDKTDRFAELERKWKCFQCQEGILRLIIVPGGETNRYFRKCSMCEHRTDVKEYTEEVEGIK
jgi:predicted  nucleic acid-binding Zn-ribbon protein